MRDPIEQVRNGAPETILDILAAGADRNPRHRLYTFLGGGKNEAVELSWGELDQQARRISALLQEVGSREHGVVGERVVLLYPPGLEFITAFFGCLMAGAVAVPAYPPRRGRTDLRLRAILRDARPSVALTTRAFLPRLRALAAETPELQAVAIAASDDPANSPMADSESPAPVPERLAFLQYTSGSTAVPRGVEVGHAPLIRNQEMIRRAFGMSSESVVVSWLPLYHDMGLIGAVLQPLYVRARCVLMSPTAFLQRPRRWLEAISRYRGTTSGGPNFAFDLCVQRIAPDELEGLDLSSWTVAFNGAEPVRAATLESFAERFAPAGFLRRAFYPCYGLAEATLLVSGGEPDRAPITRAFDPHELERHRVAPQPAEEGGRLLVGNGTAAAGLAVAIVDPRTGERCAADQVGEIWVAGASVAGGYWQRPEATARDFRARLAEETARFLRTGDLGFLHEGELFVTGRIKDLIILRGRNHYPQDLEQTAAAAHEALAKSAGAAFSVDVDGEERLVVVQEVERRSPTAPEILLEAVRRAVAETHEVAVHDIVLVLPGEVPKTSSGKVRRHACRAAYLDGTLKVVGRGTLGEAPRDAPVEEVVETVTASSRAELATLPFDERPGAVTAFLRQAAARVLRSAPAAVRPERTLTALGLDSLAAIELRYTVEHAFGVEVRWPELLSGASLDDLASEVLAALAAPLREADELPPAPAGKAFELSPGQQALWFLERLAPASAAYNVAAAARLEGKVDAPALRRAAGALAARHPALRTVFFEVGGKPRQRVEEGLAPEWLAGELDRGSVEERLRTEAFRPFSLEEGPLLRLGLFRIAPCAHVLLLVVHHLVADFWSVAVMMEELERLYLAEAGAAPAELPPVTASYAGWVAWQRRWLAGTRSEEPRRYWSRQLAGDLPALEPATDRPRPPVQTFRGSSCQVRLGAELSGEVRRLADRHQATLFQVLLAAFEVLLHRFTGQREILVGSPTLGRPLAALSGVVGYFVNPVVLRSRFEPRTSFGAFLARCRRTALEALAHCDYPFARLAEDLHPVRDPSRSPIFQTMFIWQKSPTAAREGLAAFALGEGQGRVMEWGGLGFEPLRLARRPEQLDLTLTMAEVGDLLQGGLQFNTDLFDATTARRLAEHLRVLLEGLVADPLRPLDEVALWSAGEKAQIVSEWNDSAAEPLPETHLALLFTRQAAATPERVAMVYEGEAFSYGALAERAALLAGALRDRGVGPESVVALAFEPAPDMVLGLLAIHRAGAAYLPLDPSYPRQRLSHMIEDSGVEVLLTGSPWAAEFTAHGLDTIVIDRDWPLIAREAHAAPPASALGSDHLAYVLYTSGSTGRPKGVMVAHRQVANFFAGMDRRLEHREPGVWLAVTSISFDISVLELFWTLCRGFRLVLRRPEPRLEAEELRSRMPEKRLDFSLFYFSADGGETAGEKYRLLLEGARFADRRGFSAVWTPERHFHAFGGLYPNPSVTSAALATVTERIRLRAGSVVLPLHHPIRVAEEWSVVDNLSGGRVEVSVASGWQPADFVLAPQSYADRKEIFVRQIDALRRLWRGEALPWPGPDGGEVAVRVLPRPLQAELPLWMTAAGSPETFRLAGELGMSLLTHLLGQSLEELGEKLGIYRRASREHGHGEGRVALMLHTFLGESRDAVREVVREPFTRYLRTSFGLMKSLAPGRDLDAMTADDVAALMERAFDRYFETSGLFGTPADALRLADDLKRIGVDEVACLIDFGVETEAVLAALEHLVLVRERSNPPAGTAGLPTAPLPLAEQIVRDRATHFQCTPSLLRALRADPRAPAALGQLRQLLLGGEALPAALAEDLTGLLNGELINVYGPTETTIWSSSARVRSADVTLGRPLANTQLHVVDGLLAPVPRGRAGELLIGGDGVVRGYHGRAALTAERFVPDPFGGRAGGRLYRTGDLVRQRHDGDLEFHGRLDHQIKLRGHRIELGEIETELGRHPAVGDAAVVVREDRPGDLRLVAWVVPSLGKSLSPAPEERRRELLADRPTYRLPNGLTVAQVTSPQTNALYREIFEDEIYLRHGITLEDGDCVFDVGANIGLFTLFVHQRCRAPRVYAFEPIAPTYEVLRTNVELFGLDARPFEVGVSNRDETARFTYYPEMAGLSGRFSEQDREATRRIISTWLERTGAERGDGGPAGDTAGGTAAEVDRLVEHYLRAESYECRLRPLSHLLAELGVGTVDLLKIDVERSEIQVLEGIAEDDWPRIRQIVIEVHSEELLDRCRAILESRGYRLRIDELIPVEERVEYVYMLYAVRPEGARAPSGESGPAPFSAAKIREDLAERLPSYMVPEVLAPLERLPLTPNGKVDRLDLKRRKLPSADGRRARSEAGFVAPTTELQRALVAVWQEVLGIGQVGIHDNFFETGGNSLLLLEAHGRLRKALGRDVSLVALMRHPTVSTLADFLSGEGAQESPAEQQQETARRGARQREALKERRQRLLRSRTNP